MEKDEYKKQLELSQKMFGTLVAMQEKNLELNKLHIKMDHDLFVIKERLRQQNDILKQIHRLLTNDKAVKSALPEV